MVVVSTQKTAYSYIRFSSKAQELGDSQRRQQQLAIDWLAHNPGYKLDKDLDMADLGMSAFRGKNAKVGGLAVFKTAVESGLVDPGSVLLVESLDRLSRMDPRRAANVLGDIVDAGVDVITLSGDPKRYSKASLESGFDFLMVVIIFIRANEESATKSKRIAASWVHKRAEMAKGRISTSQVPAWLTVTGEATKGNTATLTLDKERVKVLKRIYREYIAGRGHSAIASSLNADKVEPFGRGKRKAPFWRPVYVRLVLESRSVLGEYTPKIGGVQQAPLVGYYPAAIDEDTFNQAQAMRPSVANRVVTDRTIKNVLTKLAVCPICDGAMSRVFKGSGGKGGHPKLVCARAKSRAACTYKAVDLPMIEAALKRIKVPHKDMELDRELERAQVSQGALDFDIYNLVEAITRRPSAALSKKLATLEAELETVKANLIVLHTRSVESDTRVIKLRTQQLKDALTGKSPEKINTVLRAMLTKVVVTTPGGELALFWRHDGETRLLYDASVRTAESEFTDLTPKG